MKKTKLFLRTFFALFVLAMAMTFSCAVVMAATGDSWSVTADSFYSGQEYSSSKISPTSTSITASDEVSIVAITSGTNYYRAYGTYTTPTNSTGKTWSSELQVGGSRTFTITPAASGNITVYWYDNGGKDVTVGSNDAVDADNAVVTSGTAECTANTSFTVIAGGSNVCILEIAYEPFSSDETTYTATGSVSGLSEGDTFTIGSFTATVDSGASTYTITKTSSSDPFASAGTCTASYTDEYTASYGDGATGVTFTVSDDDSTAYTVSPAITFSEVELGDIAAGTYTSYSRPSFTASQSSSSTKFTKNAVALTFQAGQPLTAAVTFKNGSSSTAAYYSILNGSETTSVPIARSAAYAASGTGTETFFLPAGTYSIMISGADSYIQKVVIAYADSVETDNGVVVSDGTGYYVIAYVSDTDLEDKTSLTLGNITTTTVYASATVNSKTYSKDSCHVYAVKIPLSTFTSDNCADAESENILNFKYTLNSESDASEA